MLTLIAESKTMTPCNALITEDDYKIHRPAFERQAADIIDALRDYTVENLAEAVKISIPMARKLKEMIYDFHHKSSGENAIKAFTGVVFKAFGYPTLNVAERTEINRVVRIISSLYGWLTPDDIIKSYRFDFTTKLAPEGKTFAAYWKKDVTRKLIEDLSNGNHSNVLNLLPGDASKCIDWKEVSHTALPLKVDFKEITAGGEMRTPNSGRLKTLRGMLLRHIITEGISSPEQLLGIESETYIADPSSSTADTIVFHTVANHTEI